MVTRIGTPYYVAPEILRGTSPYTVAADMWSIGVIVYFMTHGYTPWHEESESKVFKAIMEGDFIICEDEVSPMAADFIKKLLVVEPSDRMTIDEALFHPWLAQIPSHGSPWRVSSQTKTVLKAVSE